MEHYKRQTALIHRKTLALSFGLFGGFTLFILTVWLLIKGGETVGPHLALLGQYLPGYKVTWLGSLIGFFWGVVWGGVIGYIYGSVYNFVVDLRE